MIRQKYDRAAVEKWAAYMKEGHTLNDAAQHFKVAKGSIFGTLKRYGFPTKAGKPEAANEPQVEKSVKRVTPRPSRQLYFLAKQVDEAIIQEIKETDNATELARLTLILTQEILKGASK